jgi:hypothetical protein
MKSMQLARVFPKNVQTEPSADSIIQDKREDVTLPITSTVRAAHVNPTVIQEIKLPTIKLEPFLGHIELSSRFCSNLNLR